MDPAVEPGMHGLYGSIPEGGKGPLPDPELQLRGIGIGEMIPEFAAQRFRGGSRNSTVPAGILRERRGLQVRAPVGIEIFIDHRLGAHGIIGVFYIPALNKGVE